MVLRKKREARLDREVEKQKKKFDKNKGEYDEAKQLSQKVEKKYDYMQKSRELQVKVLDLREKIDRGFSAFKSLEKELKDNASKVSSFEKVISEVRTSLKGGSGSLSKKLSAVERNARSISKSLDSRMREVGSVLSKIGRVSEDVDQISSKFSKLKDEQGDAVNSVDALSSKLENLDFEKLDEVFDNLDVDLKSLDLSLKKNKERVSSLVEREKKNLKDFESKKSVFDGVIKAFRGVKSSSEKRNDKIRKIISECHALQKEQASVLKSLRFQNREIMKAYASVKENQKKLGKLENLDKGKLDDVLKDLEEIHEFLLEKNGERNKLEKSAGSVKKKISEILDLQKQLLSVKKGSEDPEIKKLHGQVLANQKKIDSEASGASDFKDLSGIEADLKKRLSAERDRLKVLAQEKKRYTNVLKMQDDYFEKKKGSQFAENELRKLDDQFKKQKEITSKLSGDEEDDVEELSALLVEHGGQTCDRCASEAKKGFKVCRKCGLKLSKDDVKA